VLDAAAEPPEPVADARMQADVAALGIEPLFVRDAAEGVAL
jgi:hypothetical protein